MSPPIYTPDGTEVSEIVLPDGSTASEVIGPDGNVVFEAAPDIPDSGVSRYTFDNVDTSSGNTLDSWGNIDGTIDGATTGVSGANQTYTTNEAYSFDGTNDVIDFGTIDWGLTDDAPVSIAAWVNTSDNSGQIFSVSNERLRLTVGDANGGKVADGNVGIAAYDGSTHTGVGTSLLDSTWVHVVGTFDGTDGTIYTDGSQQNTGSLSYVLTGNRSGIGGDPDTSQHYLSAIIDDVRVYDKALSPTEVSNLYNTGYIG